MKLFERLKRNKGVKRLKGLKDKVQENIQENIPETLTRPHRFPTHVLDYLYVLTKHRWIIAAFFSVIVVTTVLYSFTATPIYEATVRLIIEKENPNVMTMQEVMRVDTSGTDYYQTQYKIIESRAVAREVVKRLQLDKSGEFSSRGKNSFIGDAIGAVRDSVRDWWDSVMLFFTVDFKDRKSLLPEGAKEPDAGLISSIISKTKVKPIRNSRLVDVSFESKDPELAARTANTIAQAYIGHNLAMRLKGEQEAAQWLNEQIGEERKKVEAAELALHQYKQQQGIITDFSSNAENITAQKLAQLNTQVVDAEGKRVEAETRFKTALAQRRQVDKIDSIPEVINNPLIKEIKTMEVGTYKRMSELSKKYGKNHPQMVALASELKTLQQQKLAEVDKIIQSLNNEYQVALAKERSLKSALGQQKQETLNLNQKAIDYNVLKNDSDRARQMYDLLIKRFKETSLAEEMKTVNIRVVDKAEIPKAPSRPRKAMNILLSIVIGLTGGVGIAFLLEYLDDTVKIPEDIKHHLNIPYLGYVPEMPMGDDSPSEEGEPELVTLKAPRSVASEAYRGIRTAILFSDYESGNNHNIILVSSANPKEGKTITSINLAVTMAQAGNRVVILDCDMRKPKVHKVFNIDPEKGVSTILKGDSLIGDAVIHTPIQNLDIIPCGPIPENASELLGSERMSSLLDSLRETYRHIIIDSPPLSAVTDAMILTRVSEGIVVVVRANDTSRKVVGNIIEQLRSLKANIIGGVLNAVDSSRENYYYYHYYYYTYYYGEDGEKKRRKVRKSRKSKDAYLDKTNEA